MTNLQPLTPQEAKDWYIDSRKTELSESTTRAHKYRLSPFVRFCEEDIENMSELSGRHFDQYKIWRRENGDLNNVTLNTQLSTIRVFIKWAEGVDAVAKGTHEYITPPSMAPKKDVRTVTLEDDKAADILRYYQKYEYATRNHVLIALLWHTGMRMGAARAIDLDDIDHETQSISLHHRPDQDTPPKNGVTGERPVAIKEPVFQILEDYIDHHRKPQTDKYGREPLFTTRYGRISIGAIRKALYAITRPCVYNGSCQHGEEIDDCEAAGIIKNASQCPSSVSPHAVRKGTITWARLNDVPIEAISERMDVSPGVLKKHYDQRTPEQEMESRRKYFEGL